MREGPARHRGRRARGARRAAALCGGTGRGAARRDERHLRRHRAPDRAAGRLRQRLPGGAVGRAPSVPRLRRGPQHHDQEPGRLREARAHARFRRRRLVQPGGRGHHAHRRRGARAGLHRLRRLRVAGMEARVDERPHRHGHHPAAFRELHGPLRGHARPPQAAVPEPRRHGRVHLEEVRPHRPHVPAGARQDGRGDSRPAGVQVHHARLHAHLRGVPRRRGHLRPRARVHGREGRQQGGHLGHERAGVVHHVLGHHQDRRRAGHGEHGLQDSRGRVPAAPERHAHAGHDRPRARFRLRGHHQRAVPRNRRDRARQAAALQEAALPAQRHHGGLPACPAA